MNVGFRQDVAVSADIKYAQFNILCYNRENTEKPFNLGKNIFKNPHLYCVIAQLHLQQREKLSTFFENDIVFFNFSQSGKYIQYFIFSCYSFMYNEHLGRFLFISRLTFSILCLSAVGNNNLLNSSI